MLACTVHRRLICTCTRVQSNPLTERKVRSRTHAWCREMRMWYTHTSNAINERQRRPIRPVEVYEFVDFLLLSEVPTSGTSAPAPVLYRDILYVSSSFRHCRHITNSVLNESSWAMTKARHVRCKWCQFLTCRESNCCLTMRCVGVSPRNLK